MDGLSLIRGLRTVLAETDDTSWLDLKYSYDCLYDAAIATVERCDLLTKVSNIATVINQYEYTLPGMFMKPYMVNEANVFIMKYSYGGAYYWPTWKPYNYIYMGNQSGLGYTATIPTHWSIKVDNAPTLITGTATSAGALATGGESTLTDTAATFLTTEAVDPGDFILNTTSLATGIITVVTDTTHLQTAMFNNTTGEPEGWNSSDAYTITKQGRFAVVVDPPSTNANGEIKLPYIARPDPVYNYTRAYPFPLHFKDALIAYACWKYKYRNQEPNFGDGYYKIWDVAVQRLAMATNTALNRKGFRVNMIKPAQRSGTIL